MSRLFEALRNAADGAFVIDDELRVVYWNKAAENILGFTDEDVSGRFCYQLLQGRAEGKSFICKAQCRVAKLAFHSSPVPNYDVRMKTKQGEHHWVNMSVFPYRMNDANGKKTIVHLFRDFDQKEVDEKALDRLVKVINRYHDIRHTNEANLKSHQNTLTSREREILSLLADGHSTQEIAQRLTISVITVRNHIQHILQKLQAHSRLEAVAIATRYNLID